jgi:site-specific DNA-methyltransferase (adenine-specific)
LNLILGECIEEMSKLPSGSIDLCLTDPPYGTTACKWDSVIPFEPMWAQLKRIVKPNGAICLFGSEPFSSALRMSNIKMFKYDWVWNKTKASNFQHARRMPMKRHETISVFGGNAYYLELKQLKKPVKQSRKNKGANLHGVKIIDKGDYFQKETGFKFSDIYFANPSGKGHFHPTQKPVALLEYLIKTYTLEGETVLDFTMGSGSTGVACKNLNRNFVGIERDEKYFKIAQERILA